MKRDTGSVRLPALPPLSTTDPALKRWVDAVVERLEVREGSRGNEYERSVTKRELDQVQDVLDKLAVLTKPKTATNDQTLLNLGPGLTAVVATNQFADSIRQTQLYQDLMRRIDDPERFNWLSSELRSLVTRSIAGEAAARGAEVRRTQVQIQDLNRSVAAQLTEITAALGNNSAGVRELQATYVNSSTAQALQITQLESSLGNYYQDGTPGRAALEQTLSTQANYITGLQAQYTLKVSAGGAIAGFGIAATEVGGVPSSAFIISADKFAIVSPTYSGGLTTTPNVASVPFGVDANGIYINGTVRINAGGESLSTIATNAAVAPITYIGSFSSAPSTAGRKKNEVYRNTTDGNSYILSADGGVWQLYLEKGATGATGAQGPAGDPATAYAVVPAAAAIQKTIAGAYTPSAITFTAYSATGANAPTTYAGRFIVATTTDGTTYTNQYTSAANETSYSYTVPASIKAVRVRLYLAGGTTVLIDEQVVPVVSDGATGANAISLVLNNDAHVVPADSSGNVTSFTGAASTVFIYEGATDVSSLWTVTKVDTNCTSTLSTRTATVTALSADVGYVDFTATRSGYSNLTARFTVSKARQGTAGTNGTNGTNGSNGTRGSVTAYASGSAWSDSTANSAILTFTGSSTLVVGDTVTISNGTNFAQTRYWSGSAWVTPGVVIDGNLLVNGTISGNKIGANTITATNINGQNLTIFGGSHTSSYTWPASGGGFHLSSSGLLLGNFNTGSYFQVTAAGAVSAPGLVISSGTATFSGTLSANIVNTNQIVGGAASTAFSATGTGATVTLAVTVPSGASAVLIDYYLGPPFFDSSNVSKGGGGGVQGPILTDLSIVGIGNTGAIIINPGAGTYTLSATRASYSAGSTMRLSALILKR